MKWRLNLIAVIFAAAFFIIAVNLYSVQINKNRIYVAKGESQSAGNSGPIRGNIYLLDKNHTLVPAALNKEYYLIYSVPKEIGSAYEETAGQLAPLLNLDRADLEKRFQKPNDLYEVLVRKASQDQVDAVLSLNLKGIYVRNQLLRFYPLSDFASQVLGFVAPSDPNEKDVPAETGKYGAEAKFNDLLSRTKIAEGNTAGANLEGQDVILTIDRTIQTQSEKILSQLIADKKATGGSVIVQDPYSGRILAMASFPDFDPNNYSGASIKNFLNPTISAVYEPGSIFKVITMAIGIDSGKITPDTKYNDTGTLTINGRTISNWDNKAHGIQTMTQVIEGSVNTGAVFAERQVDHGVFYDYLKKFGLSDLSGIELPSEVKGNLKSLINGREINYATAAYGQGVAVTPLELIGAVSAIANGGNLMKPLILDNEQPKIIRRVISQDTAEKVTSMMVSAVRVNILADIRNYSVAGKTGTAYVPDFKNGGYTDDVINSYAGFAPAFNNPKFVVLIKLDKPAGAPLSGETVVPAFKQLAQFILNYYNVPPDAVVGFRNR